MLRPLDGPAALAEILADPRPAANGIRTHDAHTNGHAHRAPDPESAALRQLSVPSGMPQ